jgi:capsule polysaccharide export protein KpsE/RkpR
MVKDISLKQLGGYATSIIAIAGVFGLGGAYIHDAISQELDDYRQEQAVIDAKQDLRTDPLEISHLEDQLFYAERSLDEVNFSLQSDPVNPDLLRRKLKAEQRIQRVTAKLEKLYGED